MTAPSPSAPLLRVENLQTQFSSEGVVVKAVDGVSFEIHRGKTLALVGESGSGKSVTSYSLLRLVQSPGRIVGGSMKLTPSRGEPIDIAALRDDSPQLFAMRGDAVSMVFQEPMTALSPVHTIGSQIAEAILVHQKVTPAQARQTTIEMLTKVGIPDPERRFEQFPHEFSGGMRQRVVIAMALVCRPDLLIADEPTTALDVTVQAQILGLIKELQREIGCGVLLITHDFGVVAQVADDVAVMRRGQIVESGSVREILRNPQHEYTRMLLDALPSNRPSCEAPAEESTEQPLLRVRNLCKHFPVRSQGFRKKVIEVVKAVDDVSFDLAAGETLGLVGESGSGKTTAARCILRALDPTSGSVELRLADGRTVSLSDMPAPELIKIRPHAQMVFQDPFSSLNPRMTVRDIIGEPLIIHKIARGVELDDRVAAVMDRVGLTAAHRERYPHAFSGGQRQRIGIARAIIMNPSLVICDEATSALDVSVQAQVLDLLKELQRELNLSYLFVAHNLDVVRTFCERVAVMRRGRIVEFGRTADVFNNPQHPYTRLLLSVVPSPDPDKPINFNVATELAALDAKA